MLNKTISTPIALTIILILAIIVGVVNYWGHTEIQNIRLEAAELNIPEKEEIKEEETEEVKIEILEEGNGEEAKNGDTISVHYIGTLKDGTKFDSSLDRGQPFAFILGIGQVIKGWDLGVLGMKVGEKRKLTIPSALGYGKTGVPGVIPPDAVLVFEIELLSISE